MSSMQSYCMCISPTIKPSIMLFPQVMKIKYSHYLYFYINPTGAVMDCYYIPGTSVMCPNLWLINTRHHILFIISDAARAAITAWPLPLWDLITEPCMSHSIYYLRMRSTNVGHLPETACGRESLPLWPKWTWSCREHLCFTLMQVLLFVIRRYLLGVLSVSATWILQYSCGLNSFFTSEMAAEKTAHPECLHWTFRSYCTIIIRWSLYCFCGIVDISSVMMWEASLVVMNPQNSLQSFIVSFISFVDQSLYKFLFFFGKI